MRFPKVVDRSPLRSGVSSQEQVLPYIKDELHPVVLKLREELNNVILGLTATFGGDLEFFQDWSIGGEAIASLSVGTDEDVEVAAGVPLTTSFSPAGAVNAGLSVYLDITWSLDTTASGSAGTFSLTLECIQDLADDSAVPSSQETCATLQISHDGSDPWSGDGIIRTDRLGPLGIDGDTHVAGNIRAGQATYKLLLTRDLAGRADVDLRVWRAAFVTA